VRKGVRAPKGILLYGPPGTGKTMLAKAMAGESDVSFIPVDANDFLKSGAEGVHQVFRVARKYAPAVLFIDEIDSVAKDRQTSYMGEATGSILTAFLTEMDGFKTQANKPVFLLAATNYSVDPTEGKSIDPALLRRFDRRIMVDLPNKAERLEFIQKKIAKHKNVKVSEEQLDNIAIRSANMSLADIDSVIELALRNCIKNNNLEVDDAGLEEAFESFNNGEAKKFNRETIEKTARHEAGHALICWLNGETPSYLTIVARGGFGGYMQHGDNEERFGFTKNELLGRIRVSLAGRAAEMVYYGEDGISTGASADLATATKIAYNMICTYGMDDQMGLSTIDLANCKDLALEKVKQRVDEILKEECDKAFAIINENKSAINEIVSILLAKNQMKGIEMDKVFSKFFPNRK
jgi:ATP-dependent Zn protease